MREYDHAGMHVYLVISNVLRRGPHVGSSSTMETKAINIISIIYITAMTDIQYRHRRGCFGTEKETASHNNGQTTTTKKIFTW